MYGIPWPLFFASCCNLLWKHCNLFIFKGVHADPHEIFCWIICIARDSFMAQSMITSAKAKVVDFRLKYIRWKPPLDDWVKD